MFFILTLLCFDTLNALGGLRRGGIGVEGNVRKVREQSSPLTAALKPFSSDSVSIWLHNPTNFFLLSTTTTNLC